MSSKRFIKQIIPLKVWRKLDSSLREAWYYMWMTCDESGIFYIDEDLYEFNNKTEFPLEKIKIELKEWLDFTSEKILIKAFIQVNYGEKLNPDYNPHKPLFRAISKNNLKLDLSLNQASFKLVDEDEEEYVDVDEEETFEKSEKLLSIVVDPETLLSISDLEKQFENEVTWKESLCRNFSEVRKGFNMESLENYLEQFFKLIKGDGEECKTVKDTKKHFNRWLKIEIQKTDGKDKTNTEIFSEAMQSETAKQFRFK